MITPLLATAVNASVLPDEINYEPYKVRYNQLAAEVDVITSSINTAKTQLQLSYNQEASLYNQIQNLEDENGRLQTQIADNEDQREVLVQRSEDLEDKLNTLNRRINGLERDRNQIERELLREERRLAPIQNRVSRIESKLSRKKIEVNSARRSFTQVQRISKNLRAQLNKLKAERKTLKTQLTSLQTQLANLDSQLSKAQATLTSVSPKLSAAKATLKTATAAKTKLATDIKALQKRVGELIRADRANPEIKKLRAQIAAKTKRMRAQQVKITNINKKISALKIQKTRLTKTISRLTQQKKTLPTQIKRKAAALKTKKQLIITKKTEVGNAEKKTAERRLDVDRLAGEANQIQTRLTRSRQELIRESRTHANLLVDLDNINQSVRVTQSRLQQTSNALNSTTQELDRIERQLPQLARSISINRNEIQKHSATLVNTQDKIASLNSSLNNLESEQTTAITSRDRKYQEYLSRFNYYGQKLSEAKTIGASQTDIALELAQVNSNAYVDSRSNELGQKMGVEVANAQAELWASVRSEIKGYYDGYKVGHASSADQSRGEIEGNKAGIRSANDYADRVLKPQFFNNIFSTKIESSQFKINEIVENIVKSMERIDAQEKGSMDAFLSVAPISASELEQSLNVRTSLDQSIETFKTNLIQVLEQKLTMGTPSTAYQAPSNIPYSNYSCSNVYKNISEFEIACKNSFLSTFKTKYTSEYFENFAAQYNELYSNIAEETRVAKIDAQYNDDLDKFYPIAKDSGIADGKADIYKEAYGDSKTAAYNNQLPTARANAEITAGKEVDSWVNSNATLTLKGASITDTSLRGGSRAKVNLKVKNISPTSLSKPVKVVITSAQNAQFSNKVMYIKVAPGNNTINFKDINFRINPEARSNQPIVIKGKVVLSGGKYNAERVETFTASATTAMNPAVKASYKYISTPQVLTRFRRRTIIQNFDVTVTPKIESVRSGYTMTMSAVAGFESMINFKNTTVNTGGLSFGYSKNVRFQYTFPRSSRGKLVKIQLNYTHEGKVIKSEIIELKPF